MAEPVPEFELEYLLTWEHEHAFDHDLFERVVSELRRLRNEGHELQKALDGLQLREHELEVAVATARDQATEALDWGYSDMYAALDGIVTNLSSLRLQVDEDQGP